MTRLLQTHDVVGFQIIEEEFIAAGGTETFTLAQTPLTDADKLPGRNVQVFVDGVENRWMATATLVTQWDAPLANQVRIPSLTISQVVLVRYAV